jgi:hypothetical protein
MTVKAIKITGTAVKLTGIRPEIAQTFVKLGVNLNDIQVFSSLHQVLKTRSRRKERQRLLLFFSRKMNLFSQHFVYYTEYIYLSGILSNS